ncbi:hypothetical protein EVAR_99331_1 [Eumeta japonica]|uniref:Uncharacterized protein n=1 Tax=Eumeta variegata TaxID=151549 RepID=A0A4C1ZFU8_EUMVA|nr:hypothetical protein EVAR_99331_1 [Eumeta japonica]
MCEYITALRVRHSPETGECDAACVHVHYCAITRADYQQYRSCVQNPASALASHSTSGCPLITVILASLIILFYF